MERLIEKIKDRMAQYNLTSYNIAKNTGIGQSHLSMIFNGKRKIKPAQFYAIIEQIPMPLKAKSNLADEFCRLYFTEERYLSIKYIRELFKQLSDLTSSVEDNKKLMDPQISELGFKDTVYRGSDISLVIAQMLVNEFALGSDAVYAYLPLAGNIETLKNCIDSTVRVYKHNTKLYALVDYLGYPQQGASNIEKLKNLLPLTLSDDTDSYKFYASNVPSDINENYSTPYPYFIAFSGCVIFLSASTDEIMLHSDPEVVKSVRSRCEGRIKHYNKCIESNTDVYSMINEVVKNQGGSDYFCSLEYEPCLAMHFNIDIINDIVYPDLPPQVRESVLSLANERLMQLKCIKKSKRIFNKNSLMDFAKTGIIYELKDYARPLEP
ncbi:MAG: helix-turn-helix transcriptional regulator, partial [Firmicutes bacterium]|nr:helix-turn-helix transcriptional regulator [Bacillota bacterium]